MLGHRLADVPSIWIYASSPVQVPLSKEGSFFQFTAHSPPCPDHIHSHQAGTSLPCSLSLLHGPIVLSTCSYLFILQRGSDFSHPQQLSLILILGLWIVHFLPGQVAWKINPPAFIPPIACMHSLSSLPLLHDLTELCVRAHGGTTDD